MNRESINGMLKVVKGLDGMPTDAPITGRKGTRKPETLVRLRCNGSLRSITYSNLALQISWVDKGNEPFNSAAKGLRVKNISKNTLFVSNLSADKPVPMALAHQIVWDAGFFRPRGDAFGVILILKNKYAQPSLTGTSRGERPKHEPCQLNKINISD